MSDYDFLTDIEQLDDDSSSDNDENTNEQPALYDGALNELAKLMMLDARHAAGVLNMGARDFKIFYRTLGVNRWPAKSLRSLHMMQVTMCHHAGFEPMQTETEAYVHSLRTNSTSLQDFLTKGLPDNIIRIQRLLYNYLNTIYPKT